MTHIPNPYVIANSVMTLEAQASSEIENIVTTAGEMFLADQGGEISSTPAAIEALRGRYALWDAYEGVSNRPVGVSTAIRICTLVKGVEMNVRDMPGTRIARPTTGEIVYSPPEGVGLLRDKLANWEAFIHGDELIDPVVRMAIAHYQFEAIHPFTDGNGRTGRVLNLLLLVEAGLIAWPTLFLSRYLIENKSDYYRLLLKVTTDAAWEEWILYIIEATRASANETRQMILDIQQLRTRYATDLSAVSMGMQHNFFLDLLIKSPYYRIQQVMDECAVTRPTASTWLKALEAEGVVRRLKIGRNVLYMNLDYMSVLNGGGRST